MKQPSISDRCIIDVNAYTSWLFDNCNPKDKDYNNLAEEDFKEKRQIVKRKYEFPLLVYLPITFRLQGDGARSEDEEYQKEIDAYRDWETDRKSTRLNSSHSGESRMPSSA